MMDQKITMNQKLFDKLNNKKKRTYRYFSFEPVAPGVHIVDLNRFQIQKKGATQTKVQTL